MSRDNAIIETLARSRERCRQLVHLYERTHSSPDESHHADINTALNLPTARSLVTRLLDTLSELPRKPAAAMTIPSARVDVERMLKETGDLLQRALVAEREIRIHATQRWPGLVPSSPDAECSC